MLVKNFIKVVITLFVLLLIITTFNNCKLLSAAESQHVFCNKDFITVQLPLTSNHSNLFIKSVYWQNLHTTREECQPVYHDHEITFTILLKHFIKCGFQRSTNKLKSKISYQQNLIIERYDKITSKAQVRCCYKDKTHNKLGLAHKQKRSVLPADFQEDVSIEILETLEQKATEPSILMEVRQNGDTVNGSVTVIPGTPLIMEIKLDDKANEIYGLKINNLQVTDMAEMTETILFRGCSIDPYLFENFNLTKTKSLAAKFRAFKFPNASFVQFRASVQICRKKCPQAQCLAGNGAAQLLRKRRELPEQQKAHDVHATFVLKFTKGGKNNAVEYQLLQNHINLLHVKNLELRHFNSIQTV